MTSLRKSALATLVLLSAALLAQGESAKDETTPASIPGCGTFAFRKVGDVDLLLHVTKPKAWAKGDRRPCLVAFFGGGWSGGNPLSSISRAKWASELGLVGVAPDYRTRIRFKGTPEDCVSDGRAAVKWVQAHAEELGIDPNRIVSLGTSAGGHVASWTALPGPGPGSDDPGGPEPRVAALLLINPVTDTKLGGYGGPKRFDGSAERALACSVPDRMPGAMPPAIVFHATGDTTVPYSNSTAFVEKLTASGNRAELVTFEGLGHSYYSSKFKEQGKAAEAQTQAKMKEFLASLGFLP